MNPISPSHGASQNAQLDFFAAGNGIAPGVPADPSAAIKAATATSRNREAHAEVSARTSRLPKPKKKSVIKTSGSSRPDKSAAKRIRNKEHQKARRIRLREKRISSVEVELTESAQIFYSGQAKAEGVKLKVYFRTLLNDLSGVVATAIRAEKNRC